MPENLSCGVNCGRALLLAFNILFILVGLGLVGIGIYAKVDNKFASILDQLTGETNFEAQSLGFLAFAMIGGGIFTLLIALFGCAGTLWNKRCLLYLYALILLILMIIELVGLIMAFVYKSKLQDVYEKSLFDVFDKGLKGNNTKVIKAFQDLETTLRCCAVHNVTDYAPYNATLSQGCIDHPTEGCSQKIIDLLNKNLPIVGYSLLSVFLLELFGVITAIALAVALKHSPDEYYSSSPGDIFKSAMPDRRFNYR